MRRIRSITPDFFADTLLAEVSPLARLFYIGLFCQLDRQGVALNDAKLLKREIFPYDESITLGHIQSYLEELSNKGRLYRFGYREKAYLFCPTFLIHQNFSPAEEIRYPIPREILLGLLDPERPLSVSIDSDRARRLEDFLTGIPPLKAASVAHLLVHSGSVSAVAASSHFAPRATNTEILLPTGYLGLNAAQQRQAEQREANAQAMETYLARKGTA